MVSLFSRAISGICIDITLVSGGQDLPCVVRAHSHSRLTSRHESLTTVKFGLAFAVALAHRVE